MSRSSERKTKKSRKITTVFTEAVRDDGIAITADTQCVLPLTVRQIATASGYERVVDYFVYYDTKYSWSLSDCLDLYAAPMTRGQVAVRIVHAAFERASGDYTPFPFSSYEDDLAKTGPLWEQKWTKKEFYAVVKDWIEGGEEGQFNDEDQRDMKALADAAWRHDGKVAFEVGTRICDAWNIWSDDA